MAFQSCIEWVSIKKKTMAFNKSRATQAEPPDISKAFSKVWDASPFHKPKSYRISGWIFGLFMTSQ